MCSPINPICEVAPAIGSVGGHIASSVFNSVATAFADAAEKVTEWMWTVIAETTQVNLDGGWFRSTLGITATLAGVVIVAIFVLEIIKAVLRRDPAALSRATVGVGAGVLGSIAAIGVVEALLAATDALSDGVVKTAGMSSLHKLGSEIAPAGAIASVAAPALILILGLGYMIASFFVWALFIARKAMIIVAAVFAPVAFCGAASRATSGWVRRWIEFTIAMIFSKLVVVIIFTLALSLVGDPGTGMAAVGSLFSGLALMVIACFAPWMLLKLVHFIGGDVVSAHHQGIQQGVTTAGATPVRMAKTGAMKVGAVVGGGTAGAAASGVYGRTATVGAAGSGRAPAPPSPGRVPNKVLSNNPVIKGTHGGSSDGGQSPTSGPPGSGPAGPSGPPSGPPTRPQPALLPVNP